MNTQNVPRGVAGGAPPRDATDVTRGRAVDVHDRAFRATAPYCTAARANVLYTYAQAQLIRRKLIQIKQYRLVHPPMMDRLRLLAFIDKYRSHTCLWDTNHPDYANKRRRFEAHKDILPIIDEGATVENVRRKIDILRNSYNRELRKMEVAKLRGEEYTPRLWYFDRLSFLSFMAEKRASRPSMNIRVEKVKSEVDENSTNSHSEDGNIETRDDYIINEPDVFIKTESDSMSENRSSFGAYLDAQLDGVSSDQRFLAEKLMSDILYLARTNQLEENSVISTQTSCDYECSSVFTPETSLSSKRRRIEHQGEENKNRFITKPIYVSK